MRIHDIQWDHFTHGDGSCAFFIGACMLRKNARVRIKFRRSGKRPCDTILDKKRNPLASLGARPGLNALVIRQARSPGRPQANEYFPRLPKAKR
jgi:hypothetical protein